MTDPTRHAIADARQALALVEDAYSEHCAQIAAAAAGLTDTRTALASIRTDVERVTAERDRYAAALTESRADAARSETCAIEAARERDDARGELATERAVIAAWIHARRTGEPVTVDDLAQSLELAHYAQRHVIGADEMPPPLPTTEDYRVVGRDEDAADEPSGGWQQIGSTVATQAEAEQQMATRRRHHPDWPGMAIWRQQQVWSVAAAETRDASRAPESAQDAPGPSNDPTPG